MSGLCANSGRIITVRDQPNLLNRIKEIVRRANQFCFSEIMSSPGSKNISLHNSGNQNYNLAHPGPQEGRFAIVTMRGLECGGRFCFRRASADDGTKAYGEVVWSWRRDAGAKLVEQFASDGDKKARSPGRARSKP